MSKINALRSRHLVAVALTLGAASAAHAGPTADCTSGVGANSLECGVGSAATGTNSIALGYSSIADADDVISVGAPGAERRVVNVAGGSVAVGSTDAVNGDQLWAVQQASLATTNAANALANSAIVQNANQDAQISALEDQSVTYGTQLATLGTQATALDARVTSVETQQAQVTTQGTQIASLDSQLADMGVRVASVEVQSAQLGTRMMAVESASATQDARISAVEAVNAVQNSRLDALDNSVAQMGARVATVDRNASGGIAAAMAMGGTLMPADKKIAVSFNLATYRGEQGFSGVGAVKMSNNVYFNAGVAGSTVRGSTGGRVGMTFAW